MISAFKNGTLLSQKSLIPFKNRLASTPVHVHVKEKNTFFSSPFVIHILIEPEDFLLTKTLRMLLAV